MQTTFIDWIDELERQIYKHHQRVIDTLYSIKVERARVMATSNARVTVNERVVYLDSTPWFDESTPLRAWMLAVRLRAILRAPNEPWTVARASAPAEVTYTAPNFEETY